VDKIKESFGPFFDYVGRTTGSVQVSIDDVKGIRDGFMQLKRKFGMTLEEEKDAIKASDTRTVPALPPKPEAAEPTQEGTADTAAEPDVPPADADSPQT
jgi:hypothetical protein